jgi:hypothetical protein
MAIWSGIIRGITRMVGWGLRSIGLGIQEMSKKLTSYGIDPYQASVQKDLRNAVAESDYWGTYDSVGKYDEVPQSLMVESDMTMRGRYRTVYEVTLYNPSTDTTITKYASIYHDKNISDARLQNMLDDMFKEREEYYEYKDYVMKSAQRKLVYHRAGYSY